MMYRWSICEYRNLNHSSREVWATVEFRITEGSTREESAGVEVLIEAQALIARRGARGLSMAQNPVLAVSVHTSETLHLMIRVIPVK